MILCVRDILINNTPESWLYFVIHGYSRGLNVILTDLLLLQYDQFPEHCVFLIYLGQWAMPSLIFI